ncbi:MAG: polymerase [Spirochaetaceae bacterium]|jgi:hypothetical protein|nr:polymerase [Spirochaetaceae bacterium]
MKKQKLLPSSRAILVIFLLIPAPFVFSAGGETISGYLDWENMVINAEVRLNLRNTGISMPSGRALAEERLFSEYFSNIQPFLQSIPVDSSSVLGDFVERGELSPEMLDGLAFEAVMTPPSISLDFQTIRASYKITLSEVSSALIRHRRAGEFYSIVNPAPAASYTGVVIIADSELPIHGRNSAAHLIPCLFPKIWDTEMNLIFDKTLTDPAIYDSKTMVHYFNAEHIFRKTPSSLSPEIQKIVGDKPIRIIARGVFGITATDPIIDSADALLLLSAEQNRALLRQGRVVIITSEAVLKREL